MEILKEYSNPILYSLATVGMGISVYLLKLLVAQIKKEFNEVKNQFSTVDKKIDLGHHKHEALIDSLQYQFKNGFKNQYTIELNQRLKEHEFVNK